MGFSGSLISGPHPLWGYLIFISIKKAGSTELAFLLSLINPYSTGLSTIGFGSSLISLFCTIIAAPTPA